MADAMRLAEELRQEQDHQAHIDRMCKGLEAQIKEMQASSRNRKKLFAVKKKLKLFLSRLRIRKN